jgi:hypothetical protein
MAKRITITIPEWVDDQILGKPKNLSGRVQELVIKGYMAEKLQIQQDLNSKSQLSVTNAPKVYFDLSYFSTRVLKNMDIATFISYGGFAYA